MIEFTIANKNGEIVRYCTVSKRNDIKAQPLSDGDFYVEGVIDNNLYIDPETQKTAMKSLIEANFSKDIIKTDLVVITNLPIPCRAEINSSEYIVDDGILEINFDYPGTYEITISALNMISQSERITVT